MGFADRVEQSRNQKVVPDRDYWEEFSDYVLKDFTESLKRNDIPNGRLIGELVDDYYKQLQEGKKPEEAVSHALGLLKEVENYMAFDPDEAKKLNISEDFKLNEAETEFYEALAKAQQLARVARKNARSMLAEAQTKVANKQGAVVEEGEQIIRPLPDTFDYVLQKLTKELAESKTGPDEPLSGDALVEALKPVLQDALKFTFSMTSHPTNPTSKEFTTAVANYEQAMETGDVNLRKAAMEEIARVNLTSGRKEVSEELEEGIATMQSLYDGLPEVTKSLKESLKRNLLDKEHISEEQYQDLVNAIPDQIVKPQLWFIGDGDGNKNQNPQNLQEGIETLKEELAKRYERDFNKIEEMIRDYNPDTLDAFQEAATAILVDGNYQEASRIIKEIKGVITPRDEALQEALEDIDIKLNLFQDSFTKVEVRHNSVDLSLVMANVLEKVLENEDLKASLGQGEDFDQDVSAVLEEVNNAKSQLKSKKDFSQENRDRIENELNKFIEKYDVFQNEEVLKATKEKRFAESFLVESEENREQEIKKNTAYRVFGRLQVMAENPEAFNDLIIAEAESPFHGKTALNLLKAAGADIEKFTPEQGINIVPLFESRQDLINAPSAMAELLKDDEYRANVKRRGELNVMIAKSDTTRQSGPFARFQQEETMAMISLLQAATFEDGRSVVPENTPIVIYHGGGDSIQRGGGKITEMSYVQAKAVMQMFDQNGELKQAYKDKFEKDYVKDSGIKLAKTNLNEIYDNAKKVMGTRTTVQGHQHTLTFNGPEDAKSISEGFLANIMNQALKYVGVFKTNEKYADKSQEQVAETVAKENAAFELEDKMANRGMDVYEQRYYNPEDSIHKALAILGDEGFPKELAKLANTSSRSDTRGGEASTSDEKTIADIIGGTNVFDQRAIGLDKTATHSGTYFSNLAGVYEGLEEVLKAADNQQTGFFERLENGTQMSDDEVNKLNDLFKNSKSFRDFIRDQAVAMDMRDFDHAWAMLGEEEARETTKRGDDQYNVLLEKAKAIYQDKNYFDGKDISQEERIEISKAMLVLFEEQAHQVSKMVYAAATGKNADKYREENEGKEFGLKTTLDEVWPQVAKENAFRDKFAAPLKELAAKVTRALKGLIKQANDQESKVEKTDVVDPNLIRMGRAAYAGLDVKNNSISMMHSITRQDNRGVEMDYDNDSINRQYQADLRVQFGDRMQEREQSHGIAA